MSDLPQGPRMVRAVYLKLKPEQTENANAARLQITWDGARRRASICRSIFSSARRNNPATFARSWPARDASSKSGTTSCPCLIASRERSRSRPKNRLKGTLTLLTTTLAAKPDDLGYFHAVYNESLPTETGKFHPYLIRQGRGRFVGMYLVTDGAGRRTEIFPSGSKATSNSPATANCGFTAPAPKTASTAAGTPCPAG